LSQLDRNQLQVEARQKGNKLLNRWHESESFIVSFFQKKQQQLTLRIMEKSCKRFFDSADPVVLALPLLEMLFQAETNCYHSADILIYKNTHE